MTTSTPEPIAVLIARSSLGSRRVQTLAAGASQSTVQQILSTLPAVLGHPARGSTNNRTYSPTTNHQPTPTTQKETAMASRRTSARAAKAASTVLRDGRTSKTSKTAAGSALSQRANRSTKRK